MAPEPPNPLVVNAEQVRQLLSMKQCIKLMAQALSTLSRGEGVVNPLRWALRLPSGSQILGMMPAAVSEPALVGIKLVTVFPTNHGTDLDAHQGFVILFDSERGFPVALVDGSEITAIRTAAVSGLATDILANPNASDLALVGAGIQARTHLLAIQEVRKLDRIRVFSRSRHHREKFVDDMSSMSHVEIEAMDSAHQTVEGADIICTTTSSRQPVIARSSIAAGAHINAVGACIPTARELDAATVGDARVVVDCRESALAEAGDLLLAIKDGTFAEDDITAELGELVGGTSSGRQSPRELTVFESLGVGIEDVFTADWVVREARKASLGQRIGA